MLTYRASIPLSTRSLTRLTDLIRAHRRVLGYQGASGTIWTPFKRRRTRLSGRQKQVNRHAKIRALGERAVAILKGWKVLTKLRCCPRRATAIVQAILVLQAAEDARYPR